MLMIHGGFLQMMEMRQFNHYHFIYKSIMNKEIVLGTMNIEYPYSSLQTNNKINEYTAILNTYVNDCKKCTQTPIIDTAYYYANTQTEQVLGEMLTEYSRNEYKIATKANPWFNNDFTNGQYGQLSSDNLSRQLITSLTHLQIDYVDVFYLHCPDYETSIKETLNTCDDLWRKEKFTALGISNFSKDQMCEIFEICENQGFIKPKYYQGMYNLIARKVEEIFPLLNENSVEFWAYNPLAGGLLTGKYSSVGNPALLKENSRFKDNPIYQSIFWKEELIEKMNDFFKLDNPTECAFQWLQHGSILRNNDKIIIGVSSVVQLKTNMNCCKYIRIYDNSVHQLLEKLYIEDMSPNYYY